MGANTWIVVPAFNESGHITSVITDLQCNGYSKIVVIDDGSKDCTAKNAEKAGATVLRHSVNRGQGAALATGIEYALSEGAEQIVTFDSDGQHQAKEIKSLLDQISSGNYDIALGSRFLTNNTKIPISRKILLKGSIFVIWLFYGIKMSDAHNGFRAMSRQSAEKIEIKSNRMEHASEIINEIKRKQLRYIEVPVSINYNDPRHLQGQASYFGAIKIFMKMVLHKLMK